ncbi:muscular LMNA-interacting protein isoform X2 [Ambystoma mexicanum]|uniref:muscular LMNA-interacting protein isoform X2 n=1 Tax=Ambystoma mexicanum TaxID=8296 RepID=UPI0037E8DD14
MDLGKPKADPPAGKDMNPTLTETIFTEERRYDFLRGKPGLGPKSLRKENEVRVVCEPSPTSAMNTEQASSDECRLSPLIFTFVPSVARLPAHSKVAETCKALSQTAKELKQGSKHVLEGNPLSQYPTLQSGVSRNTRAHVNSHLSQGNEAAFEDMQHNDVFMAEYVFVLDSDEEESMLTDTKEQPHISTKQLPAQPLAMSQTSKDAHVAKRTDDKMKVVAPQEITSSCSTKGQVYPTLPVINVVSLPTQNVSNGLESRTQVSSKENSFRGLSSASGPPIHTSSTCVKTSGYSPPRVTQQIPAQNLSFLHSPSKSMMPKTTQTQLITTSKSVHKNHETITKALPKYSPTLSNFQNDPKMIKPLPRSFSPHSSLRSNTLSPIPYHIETHYLCPQPKSIESPMYGSYSTINSTEELCSATSPRQTLSKSGMSASLPTRLSFLTAILKSGQPTKRRSGTPTPYLSHHSSKSLTSSIHTISQKPSMARALSPTPSTSHHENRQPSRSDHCPPQSRKLPLSLEFSIWSPPGHVPSTSPMQPHKTIDPTLVSPKPFTLLSSCREKVVSPILRKRFPSPTISSSTSRSPSPSRLNVKPPIRKETKQPFKKCTELGTGKSRRDRAPSPTVPTYPLMSSTSSTNKRVTSSPAPEKPMSTHVYSPAYTSSKVVSTALPTPRVNVASSVPTNISPQLPSPRSKSASPILMTHNVHSCTPPPKSFSLPPSLSFYSSSPTHEQSPTTLNTSRLSPLPLQSSSSYLTLSRSCELPSAPFTSPSPDNEQKTTQYKITSRYKAFAAIPTNTLLMEQKALDHPVKKTQNGEEDVHTLDADSELYSPAQLRQQTEEVCAAIDQVLPMHHDSSASSPQLFGSNAKKMSLGVPGTAGRETRYASISSPVTITAKPHQTKPGVIRPLQLKPTILLTSEEANYYINPYE